MNDNQNKRKPEVSTPGKISWKPGNMLYPLPVVMVSCGREGETPNIITVAWAGTVCSDPAMVSISVRKERFSHKIIKDTGEFVINLVNKPLVRATDYCGVKSGRDVDKFKEMKLTSAVTPSILSEKSSFVKYLALIFSKEITLSSFCRSG